MREWLLLNSKWPIFQLYQVTFRYYNDDMHFILDQHAELDFWSASSLTQQSSYINFDKPVIYMDKNSVRENLWNFCFNCLFVAEKMAVLYIIIIIMLKFKKWIILYKIKRSHQLCFTVATQSLSVIPDIFWKEHKAWHYTHLLTLSVYYGYLFCYVIYLCVKIS